MEYFAGGLTVCARVFSALSRHLESGVDPGNEVEFPAPYWNGNRANMIARLRLTQRQIRTADLVAFVARSEILLRFLLAEWF